MTNSHRVKNNSKNRFWRKRYSMEPRRLFEIHLSERHLFQVHVFAGNLF